MAVKNFSIVHMWLCITSKYNTHIDIWIEKEKKILMEIEAHFTIEYNYIKCFLLKSIDGNFV